MLRLVRFSERVRTANRFIMLNLHPSFFQSNLMPLELGEDEASDASKCRNGGRSSCERCCGTWSKHRHFGERFAIRCFLTSPGWLSARLRFQAHSEKSVVANPDIQDVWSRSPRGWKLMQWFCKPGQSSPCTDTFLVLRQSEALQTSLVFSFLLLAM